MKILFFFFAFFATATAISAQQRLEINHFCQFDGTNSQTEFQVFEPSSEAKWIIGEILKAANLPQNFVVKSADCKNAFAGEIGTDRYLFYNLQFLDKFKQDARTKWAAYCFLAHEIGHHLKNHSFDCQNSSTCKDQELAADRFAGAVLFQLNATLGQAQGGIWMFDLENETATFPSKMARLEAVAAGWKAAKEVSLGNQKAETAAAKAQSKELLEQGFKETDFKKKIEIYTKAIDLDPKNADAYNNRGYAKNIFKQHRQAILDFDKAIEVKPNYAMAFCNRGYTKQLLGEHAEAILDFEKAIELDPKYANNYGRKGCSLVQLGRKSEAIEWLQKSLQLDPTLNFVKDCLKVAQSN